MDDRSPEPLDALTLEQGDLRELARALVHGDEHQAEDIVQDAWLVLARRPRHKIEDVRPWLAGVVRNLARSRRRREQRRRFVEREGARSESSVPAEADLDRREIEQQLTQLVADLPEPYGTVVRLRYLEDRSAEDVSEILERPATTVRSQSARGLALLRESLDRLHSDRPGRWLGACVFLASSPISRGRAPVRALSSAWTWLAASMLLLGAAGFLLGRAPESPRDRASPVLAADVGDSDTVTGMSAAPATERVALGAEPAPEDRGSRSSAFADSVGPGQGDGETARLQLVDRLGQPVPDARVFLLARGEKRLVARSAADGRAQFGFAAADLVAEVRSFAPSQIAIFVEAGAQASSDVVYIERQRCQVGAVSIPVARGGTLLRGRVLDPLGDPIAGATIRFGPAIPAVAVLEEGVIAYATAATEASDQDGRFEVRLDPGDVDLRVTSAGRADTTFHEQVVAGDATCSLRFARGHEVRGIVRMPDGQPAADAEVAVEDTRGTHTARTDGAGAYVLRDVAPGEHMLVARRNAEVDRTIVHAVVGHATVWDAQLARVSGLHVRVVDALGAPRAAWCVWLRAASPSSSWERVSVTNADGRVSLFDAPPEPMNVFVAPVRRNVPYPVAERLLVQASQGDVTFVVDDDMASTGVLAGSLMDGRARAFEGRVVLWIRRIGRELVTTVPADVHAGEFRIEGLPRGRYSVSARRGDPRADPEEAVDLGECAIESDAVTRLAIRALAVSNPIAAGESVGAH